MPKKITDFTAKHGLSTLDIIPIIDVSDITMGTLGSNKKIQAGVLANGLAQLITSNAIISANTTTSAVRITQTGTGNALLVEDSTNPDSSPFVIDNNGRAISGATAPKAIDNPYTTGQLFPKIQVVGAEADGASIGIFQAQTDAASGVLSFAKARGTVGAETIVANGDQLGRVSFQSFDGSANKESAVIGTVVDSAVANGTAAPTAILFQTKPGTNTPSESMRIASSGYVGIGTATPSTTLHVVGNATLPAATSIGNVTATQIGYLAGITSNIQAQLTTLASSSTTLTSNNTFSGNNTFTGNITLPTTTSIGNVTSTEIGYLDGVTSNIQTQLDAKANKASPTFTGTVTLPTGNATAAALKFVSGANLTTPQAGAVEFDGTNLYITNSTAARKTLAFTDAVSTYVHPTGDGNLHVPATGTTNGGKVLTAGSTAGSLSWTTLALTDVIQTKTASWTLGLGDVASYIRLKSSVGNPPIVITIPTHAVTAIPVGSDIKFYRVDGVSLSFSATGVTVNNDQIALISVGEMFALKKVADNEWDFI